MDTKTEADILRAVHLHRPAGLHRHMHMLNISNKVDLPPHQIWEYLGTLYRLDRADALGPQTVDVEIDFYGYMVRNFEEEIKLRQIHDDESASSSSEDEDNEGSSGDEEDEEDAQPRRSSRIAHKTVRKKPAKKKAPAKTAKATSKSNTLKRSEPEPESTVEEVAALGPRTRARTPQTKEKEPARKRRRK